MTDPIEVNVAGRLMVLLTRQGLLDNRRMAIYQGAVSASVRRRLGNQTTAGVDEIDRIIDQELALLRHSLQGRSRAGASVDEEPGAASGETEQAPEEPASANRESRPPSGYVPPVRSMEEKLKDARKPVQTLLREDCVRIGLIDAKMAEKYVLGMTGKTSEQAEQDIVEQLRQVLQDQVKSFIRKAKGGPWADPRTQEDLRKDIHAARSVRSILMLARQVLKEYQTWQKQNRRGGILGLFSPRKKIVQR